MPDPDAPGVGEAITSLLTGEGTLASEAFSIPSGSHVFPKLTVAVRATQDFRAAPTRYRAHLSFLFDVFPPEEVAAGRPFRAERTVPLHGLVQDFAVRFRDDDTGTGWERQPRHGDAHTDRRRRGDLCAARRAPDVDLAATATVARSTPDFTSRPIIRLELDADERALISEIHDASDWVFTVDRNMGIEFFDHGGRRDRPDYLIDYTPATVPEHGHRLVISSRSLSELEAILRPVLKQYGSGCRGSARDRDPRAAAIALGAAGPEVGLLADSSRGSARDGARSPLPQLPGCTAEPDRRAARRAPRPLPHCAKRHADEIGDEVTLRRTDLALFDLDVADERSPATSSR